MSYIEDHYADVAPKVYRYLVVRTGDRAVAEDLTSETFLKSLKYEKDFESDKRPFEPWLFRVAHNGLVDHMRKHQREVFPDEMPEVASQEDIIAETHERTVFDRVEKSLASFSKMEREIFLLKIVSGLTFAEISGIVGLKENTIKTKYFRTLGKLKKHPETFLSLLITLSL